MNYTLAQIRVFAAAAVRAERRALAAAAVAQRFAAHADQKQFTSYLNTLTQPP
jgi:hypothetical protein